MAQSGGLYLGSALLNLRPANDQYRSELIGGGPDQPPIYKGSHLEAPLRPGMTRRPMIANERQLELEIRINGLGATMAARRESYLAAAEALRQAYAPEDATGELGLTSVRLVGPYFGLPTGEVWEIECQYYGRQLGAMEAGWTSRKISLVLSAFGNPPEWEQVS